MVEIGRSALVTRRISVVVPVYSSTDTLPSLVRRIHDVFCDIEHEILLVDDGSPRATWDVVRTLASGDNRVVGIRLGRNSGQHSALLAGVRAARYEVTITIDDDLQNPPEEAPKLLAALGDNVDLVYGTPEVIEQQSWRRLGSRSIRRLMSTVLGVSNATEMSSFRAFRTNLRNGFDDELGPGVSLDALLAWSTSRSTGVSVAHHARDSGRSNYSFRRLLRFALDTATGYSAIPLQIALALGVATAVLGFCVLAWVIGRSVVSGTSTPGFAFLACIISIFSGVQLMTLGIIGEYLARMHFRVMRKPSYVIVEQLDHRPKN